MSQLSELIRMNYICNTKTFTSHKPAFNMIFKGAIPKRVTSDETDL